METARRARSTSFRRNSFSSAGLSSGFPTTCGIPAPVTMRFAPTFRAMELNVAMRAAGSPALSISLAIADPQRVQVPHVAVMRAASTSDSFNSWAIASPMRAPAS